MSRRDPLPDQLGFDALLASAACDNAARQIARECSHLPDNFDEALSFFRDLIRRHHAAMLAGDAVAAPQMREEADRLALRLNNFEPGILAGADAPGCRLDRATRAPEGEVPLWGQSGSFEITTGGMRVRIEMQGIFGPLRRRSHRRACPARAQRPPRHHRTAISSAPARAALTAVPPRRFASPYRRARSGIQPPICWSDMASGVDRVAGALDEGGRPLSRFSL